MAPVAVKLFITQAAAAAAAAWLASSARLPEITRNKPLANIKKVLVRTAASPGVQTETHVHISYKFL